MTREPLPKVTDLARGKWRDILTQLGIAPDLLDGKNHPCPRSGEGRDRFRFADRDGRGSFFCHCDEYARRGKAGGLSLLMCCRKWSYQQAAEEVEKIVGAARIAPPPIAAQPANKIQARQRIILATCSAPADAVVTYLDARGLKAAPGIQQGRAKYWDTSGPEPVDVGTFDVMVCQVVAPNGSMAALHLTYLQAGRKLDVSAPRKILGSIPDGAAIRLMPISDTDEDLGVGEGIETMLAASAMYAVPTWACHSSGVLAKFEPPSSVKRLWIFADNDASAVGQIAAFTLKQRMHQRGIAAYVVLPDREDTDWNDKLMEKAA